MITPPAGLSPEALQSLLLFYRDAGVDAVLSDVPLDRFAESQEAARKRQAAAPPAQAPRQAARPARGSTETGAAAPVAGRGASPQPAVIGQPGQMTVPDKDAFEDARAAAAGAGSVAELKTALEAFTGCNLRHSARSTVFADGNQDAELMVVGEAPGREEDLQGLPFVGRAGQLLDRMLGAIGYDRASAYITNVVFWRPPGNRTPAPHEIELCLPFAERHIELVRPKALLLLGNVSVKSLTRTDRGILSIRGRFLDYERDGLVIPAMPSLHPAYLLRSPAQKRLAWTDLLALAAKIETLRG